MNHNIFPAGWNEERVRQVLAHYEQQTEADAVVEDDSAYADASQTVIEIPNALVPLVRDLIAQYQRNSLNVSPQAS